MPRSVLERYGGFPFLSRVVMAFYDRALDSDVLAPYFENVDMRRLIDHQTKFMAFLLGGPASYTNDHLRNVHHHLAIDEPSFEVMIDAMQATLEEFDMDDGDIATVVTELRAREPWIITTHGAEPTATRT